MQDVCRNICSLTQITQEFEFQQSRWEEELQARNEQLEQLQQQLQLGQQVGFMQAITQFFVGQSSRMLVTCSVAGNTCTHRQHVMYVLNAHACKHLEWHARTHINA
jgi:hypothetical protein